MAKFEVIRKNIITEKWEHFVDDNQNPHWAPGLTGHEYLDSIDITINEINENKELGIELYPIQTTNTQNNGFEYSLLISYEDYSKNQLITPEYLQKVGTEYINWIHYLEVNDFGIRELLPDKKPIFVIAPGIHPEGATVITSDGVTISLNSIKRNTTLLFGAKLILKIDAINPIYDMPIKLNYKWLKDDEEYIQGNIVELGQAGVEDNGVWVGEVSNDVTKNKTIKINVNVTEPRKTEKFYTNLIKNGDFSEELNNWEIIKGKPEVAKLGIWDNQLSDMFFNRDSHEYRNYIGEFPELYGPHPIDVIYKNDNIEKSTYQGMYLRGGLAGDDKTPVNKLEKFVTLKQTIDLSDVKEYIDREVIGVHDIYGNLFGWLGCMGLAYGKDPLYNEPPQPRPINYQNIPYTPSYLSLINLKGEENWGDEFLGVCKPLDRVYIELQLIDENKEIIKSEYRIYSPTHVGQDFKFFIRHQYIYIPIGTRKINVFIKFQRSSFVIANPWYQSAKLIQWGIWNQEKEKVEQIHTSAVENLNFFLYVNDTDEHINDLIPYKNIIRFNRYDNGNIPDSTIEINGYLQSFEKIGNLVNNIYSYSESAIQLKVRDLYLYSDIEKKYSTFFNHIIEKTWFRNRFTDNQINNAIIRAKKVYSLTDLDLENSIILENDTVQQYPNSFFTQNYAPNPSLNVNNIDRYTIRIAELNNTISSALNTYYGTGNSIPNDNNSVCTITAPIYDFYTEIIKIITFPSGVTDVPSLKNILLQYIEAINSKYGLFDIYQKIRATQVVDTLYLCPDSEQKTEANLKHYIYNILEHERYKNNPSSASEGVPFDVSNYTGDPDNYFPSLVEFNSPSSGYKINPIKSIKQFCEDVIISGNKDWLWPYRVPNEVQLPSVTLEFWNQHAFFDGVFGPQYPNMDVSVDPWDKKWYNVYDKREINEKQSWWPAPVNQQPLASYYQILSAVGLPNDFVGVGKQIFGNRFDSSINPQYTQLKEWLDKSSLSLVGKVEDDIMISFIPKSVNHKVWIRLDSIHDLQIHLGYVLIDSTPEPEKNINYLYINDWNINNIYWVVQEFKIALNNLNTFMNDPLTQIELNSIQNAHENYIGIITEGYVLDDNFWKKVWAKCRWQHAGSLWQHLIDHFDNSNTYQGLERWLVETYNRTIGILAIIPDYNFEAFINELEDESSYWSSEMLSIIENSINSAKIYRIPYIPSVHGNDFMERVKKYQYAKYCIHIMKKYPENPWAGLKEYIYNKKQNFNLLRGFGEFIPFNYIISSIGLIAAGDWIN